MDNMKRKLREDFSRTFGSKDNTRVFFAPGRVNLIGEHTDYVGGHVFPCALNFGTYGIVRKRSDRTVRMFSANMDEKGIIEFSLDEVIFDESHDWVNYPKGVIKEFLSLGHPLSGMDIYVYGDIPNGAGLSSSASLELLMGVIIESLFEIDIDRIELCKMSQRAENNFVGVNCGIMDQFAIGMGKTDCAILLDCDTLNYEYVPLVLKGLSIIITNTNKRRGLADSKYNERREETDKALAILQRKFDIASLGELSLVDFESSKDLFVDDVIYKRSRHSVSENERTLKAVESLMKGDLKLFGSYMNASHASLRDDYEVTCKELDTLVMLAEPFSVGVRMTGAGFGGCIVALVEDSKVEEFKKVVGLEYEKAIGYKPTFYVASVGDGAREI